MQDHPTRRQVITGAMAHSIATRSCASWRTEDERGLPKALIARSFFAAKIGWRQIAAAFKEDVFGILPKTITEIVIGKPKPPKAASLAKKLHLTKLNYLVHQLRMMQRIKP